MTEGPRQRSSTGPNPSERSGSASDAGKDAGVGVKLQKEIGLVSACGIIIGKLFHVIVAASLLNHWCFCHFLVDETLHKDEFVFKGPISTHFTSLFFLLASRD